MNIEYLDQEAEYQVKNLLPVLLLFSLIIFINANEVSASATTVSPAVSYTTSEIESAATKVKKLSLKPTKGYPTS